MTDAEKDATVRIAKRACSGAYPEGQIEFEIEQLVAEKDARIAAVEKEVTAAQFQLQEVTAKAEFQWLRAEQAEATIAAVRAELEKAWEGDDAGPSPETPLQDVAACIVAGGWRVRKQRDALAALAASPVVSPPASPQ